MSNPVRPPEGVHLSPLSARVFQILAEQTAFPWPIMMAQSRRCQLDAESLTTDGLAALIPHLSNGVARFTSPEKGEAVRRKLENLLAGRR